MQYKISNKPQNEINEQIHLNFSLIHIIKNNWIEREVCIVHV